MILLTAIAFTFFPNLIGAGIQSQLQNAGPNVAHLSTKRHNTPNIISVNRGGQTTDSLRMGTKPAMGISLRADGPPRGVQPVQALAKNNGGISMQSPSKLGRRALSSGLLGIRKAAGRLPPGAQELASLWRERKEAAGNFKTNAINGKAHLFHSDGEDEYDDGDEEIGYEDYGYSEEVKKKIPWMADKERFAELIQDFTVKFLSHFHLSEKLELHRQDRDNIDYVAKLLMLTGDRKTQEAFLGQANQLVVILHVLENIFRQSYIVCVVEDLLERNPRVNAEFLQRYFKFRELEELILGLLIHDPETTDILHIEGSQDLDGANRLIAFLEFKRGILKVDSLRAKINLGKDVLRRARNIKIECNNFIDWTIVTQKEVPIEELPRETVERCTVKVPKRRGFWNRR